MRAGMWNFPTYIDFPELSVFGFLNVHVKILSFADEHKVLLRDVFKMGHTYNDIPENLRIGAAFYCLKSSFLVLCRESWHVQTWHLSKTLSKKHNHFSFLHFFQMMSSEHLTCGWLLQLLVVLLKLCLTSSGPLQPLNGTECTAKGPASYILVFTGHWSPQAFPKQYPLFRPPAQWSKLIGEKAC